MHIISLVSLFLFLYAKLGKLANIQFKFELDLHESIILFFLASIEYKILTLLKIKLFAKIGALVAITGFLLSIYILASQACSKDKKQRLSIYKFMRQPFYAGVILLIVGSGFYCSLYLTLCYALFMYKNRFLRMIQLEENIKIKEDAEYRKYCAKVKMFIFY
ncbi:hypothetical protein COBT_000754 [Conglomerata obtusa]